MVARGEPPNRIQRLYRWQHACANRLPEPPEPRGPQVPKHSPLVHEYQAASNNCTSTGQDYGGAARARPLHALTGRSSTFAWRRLEYGKEKKKGAHEDAHNSKLWLSLLRPGPLCRAGLPEQSPSVF